MAKTYKEASTKSRNDHVPVLPAKKELTCFVLPGLKLENVKVGKI